jgi:hypothetical protein
MQRQFIPSVEHKWGLLRISTKQAWVGLTERETAMIFELVAAQSLKDWMVWQAGWPGWQPLSAIETTFEFIAPKPDARMLAALKSRRAAE